jgi:2-amino-4-hydroxy-6-hydroxymethyldihydropteridine diphosphokinase
VALVFLSLGSNQGKREEYLKRARDELASLKEIRIETVSSIYETEPWGVTDQPLFLNQVLALNTNLNPRDLLEVCRNIEQHLGRKRGMRWAPRTIDIDILLYDQMIVRECDLIIPHPRLPERRFVLVPLSEIAPHVQVPGTGGTAAMLLRNCPDQGSVARYQHRQK